LINGGGIIVAKRSSRKAKKKKRAVNSNVQENQNWLPTRGGLIVLAVVTLLLAGWITVQGMEVNGFGESLLWGLGFAASIWVVFGLVFFVNKFLRGR
jgi:hypothetical protein